MKLKDISFFLNLTLIGVLIILSKCNTNLKEENYALDNNLKVLTEKTNKLELQNGRVVYDRGVLLTDIGRLQELNKDLYKKVKEFEELKPQTVVTSKVSIVRDTFYLNNNIQKLTDSTYKVKFCYDTVYNETSSRTLRGLMLLSKTNDSLDIEKFKITEDVIRMNNTLMLGEKDGRITVWLHSDYPGLSVEEIDAVILDSKKHPILKKLNNKKFSIGPYVGVGINGDFRLEPTFGIGLQYRIFKF